MNIVFKCEFCRAEMQAAEDSFGKQCICVACGKRTTIGTTTSSPANSNDGETGSKPGTSQQLLSIACPQCNQSLDYARALIGTKGLCRNCHSLLLLPAQGRPPVIMRRPKSHIAFECPTCLQLFEGSQAQVGHKGRCTNCDSIFIIAPLEPKESPSKIASETPSSVVKRNPRPQSSPSSTVPDQSDELGLAPEPQSPIIPRPRRPAPTLKPIGKGKPSTNVPSPSVNQTPTPQPAASVPWPDLNGLTEPSNFSTVSNAYASSSVSYPSSKTTFTVGQLFSGTTNILFPAAFIIALPTLAMFLLNILAQGALYLVPLLASLMGDFWIGRLLLAIVALTIALGVPICGWICFFPLQFKLANIAAKGKIVDTSMMSMSMSKRFSIIGYTIVQYILLLPLFFVGAVPLGICFALGPSNIIVTLMLLLSFMFLFYVAFVAYSMFAIGACAIADNHSVGEGITISFRSLFAYPLVLLPICAMEFIPIAILAVTVLGFLFVGGPYVLIRSAKFNHMMNN